MGQGVLGATWQRRRLPREGPGPPCVQGPGGDLAGTQQRRLCGSWAAFAEGGACTLFSTTQGEAPTAAWRARVCPKEPKCFSLITSKF